MSEELVTVEDGQSSSALHTCSFSLLNERVEDTSLGLMVLRTPPKRLQLLPLTKYFTITSARYLPLGRRRRRPKALTILLFLFPMVS
jgi:hypothetical protein